MNKNKLIIVSMLTGAGLAFNMAFAKQFGLNQKKVEAAQKHAKKGVQRLKTHPQAEKIQENIEKKFKELKKEYENGEIDAEKLRKKTTGIIQMVKNTLGADRAKQLKQRIKTLISNKKDSVDQEKKDDETINEEFKEKRKELMADMQEKIKELKTKYENGELSKELLEEKIENIKEDMEEKIEHLEEMYEDDDEDNESEKEDKEDDQNKNLSEKKLKKVEEYEKKFKKVLEKKLSSQTSSKEKLDLLNKLEEKVQKVLETNKVKNNLMLEKTLKAFLNQIQAKKDKINQDEQDMSEAKDIIDSLTE